MKALVVWFSRTGTTRKVARTIVERTGWDAEELVEDRSRRGPLGWLRSVYDAKRGVPARLRPATKDVAAYDLVVVGTPIWAGRVSSPIATYLRAHAAALPRVALFVTFGGSKDDDVLCELARLAGRAPQARLAVRAAEVEQDRYLPAVDGFLATLGG